MKYADGKQHDVSAPTYIEAMKLAKKYAEAENIHSFTMYQGDLKIYDFQLILE